MAREDVSSWCQWRTGRGALLLVAPHGGRSAAAASRPGERPRKVNDLYTAELAATLADRLDASLIVNAALDRNELDLNRVSQVAARAPWFLDLLESLTAAILTRHRVAEVVFVHGWNVIQCRCDIGIGAALSGEDAAVHHRRALTVSPEYVQRRLSRFRLRCARAEVHATYGERYPASHPNNLLQLFRPRDRPPAHAPGARLSQWAADGRLAAVQIELGIPLRWPGPHRDRFIAAAVGAFAPPLGRPAAPRRTESARPSDAPQPVALQFHDPRAGLGLMGRIDTGAGGAVAGRLLLFLGGQRIALFTGEHRSHDRLAAEGLRAEARADGFRLRFGGPVLQLDDAALYVQLENALAASSLEMASVDATFRRIGAVPYGRVDGIVRVGSRVCPVHAYGFADASLARRTPGRARRQTILAASFGAELALTARFGDAGPGLLTRLTPAGRSVHPLSACGVDLAGDGQSPARFIAPAPAAPLVAKPLSRMAITRPLGRGRYARITFGTARFTWGESGAGSGFYEYAQRLDGAD